MRFRIPVEISPSRAITLQERFAPYVSHKTQLPSQPRIVAGLDAAYLRGMTVAAAAAVTFPDLQRLEVKSVKSKTKFPYIPGLLGFREGPAVIRATKKIRRKVDVWICDGHGVAHPRRCGLACFVGLILDQPTIGVAKSLLYGHLDGPRIVDAGGDVLGEVVKSEDGKALYVSVGHKISLRDAVWIVRACQSPQGLVPVQLAHEEVSKLRWKLSR